MITFDLECSKGHLFEGWFNNIKSFEDQNSEKLVSCPFCNDTNIRKVISPVAMRSSSRSEDNIDETIFDYNSLAKEIVNFIDKNFDDVGPDFTKEALKMHYGVIEKRNIKGSATADEEKSLKDEGIDFVKVPIPIIVEDKKN
ncbi:MAG: DUF1178 family protein [Thermodesulfobacteriota bacterium]|nr:DUF1178 family protein [Thermodesulfobacteriota bacterium]